MYSSDRYLKKLYQENIPEFIFNANTIDEWKSWSEGLRQAVIADLGGLPDRKVDLCPRVIDEKEYDDYFRQRIVYSSDEYLDVPAYVLIPKNVAGKLPAVIACHGHGYGSRAIVGLNPDGEDNTGDPGYQKNFAVELVRRGFLVIAPELLGFGDRRLEEDKEKDPNGNSCYRISTYLLMLGKTMAGARVYDILRTIDYLETREDVDSSRIGCMGISGGGLVCTFASAIDQRIAAAVISGYANTFQASIMSIFHCVDNFIPGLLRHAEMPDILGLIAPRPLLLESGTRDTIFPIYAAQQAYDQVKQVYRFLNVEDRLEHDIFEGEHQISGAKAYSWLEKWLKE